jgi:hypothetical protein
MLCASEKQECAVVEREQPHEERVAARPIGDEPAEPALKRRPKVPPRIGEKSAGWNAISLMTRSTPPSASTTTICQCSRASTSALATIRLGLVMLAPVVTKCSNPNRLRPGRPVDRRSHALAKHMHRLPVWASEGMRPSCRLALASGLHGRVSGTSTCVGTGLSGARTD